ncbi:sulfotransferase domain-containing protein [Anabaena sp. UHCC 0187]|uniref:sulfotransferase domain-containing protein n=1 Tax=Anabaena sp. UHCC 0187 TaxID=2590018 RepID=UPI0014461EBD|nr:sulfotransferase domain-containing protein [Anabaena sp. UHCC 0187]MTJ12500.1 sulfotransferase domain-containing protein [Anabaena sp. UHCC 0187]
MTMPNFLIIGAAKSGTTALDHYLKQHPQIYMSPVKELNFFALEGEDCEKFKKNFLKNSNYPNFITDIETYCSFFKKVSQEIAIGESSPLYLLHPKASERIKHYIPKVKIIAIIRDPVERAYSDFLFTRSRGSEPITDFHEALKAEKDRIEKNYWFRWYYKQRGFYFTQLKRYFDLFDKEQIKIYLHEDLKSDSLGVVQDIFQFIGVDDTFIPNTEQKHNVTYVPKNITLNNLIKPSHPISSRLRSLLPSSLRQSIKSQLINFNRKKVTPLLPEIRKQLIEEYREDILQLQDLIGKDLSKWLKV